ncbi:uncharacterized protein LOC105645539 [Jatropha curcas]|uniref:uncharacterized protein LOC105645539 n=1 Tax=Jatropha curcas TaxID=180498 RepID=UPI0005FAC805|nr:uncharacterized protein LOC105645539 [Jatropha curcas]
MTLQLADGSIKRPIGVIEDLLVKVGEFIFPIDFVVLDMKVDRITPLILERTFLVTIGALTDVKEGKLTLRLNDEEIVFDIKKAMKHPNFLENDKCFFIDYIDDCLDEYIEEKMENESPLPLEIDEKEVSKDYFEESSKLELKPYLLT